MGTYRGNRFNLLPPVVKNLLIINGLMLLATYVLQGMGVDLYDMLGLHPFNSSAFRPYQLITHVFMHGGFGHLFFNMFALWMFGTALENVWGPKRFLNYYLLTAFGAAVLHYLATMWQLQDVLQPMNAAISDPSTSNLQSFLNMVAQQFPRSYEETFNSVSSASPQAASTIVAGFKDEFLSGINMVGASGAVYGILLAFGMMFPNTLIYIYFLFPVKAKYIVILFGLLELWGGASNRPGDNIAHFAHLGGMLFGFILIKYWQRRGQLYR